MNDTESCLTMLVGPNEKSIPTTLCGCFGSSHAHVTVPPGAIVTFAGDQKYRTPPPLVPTKAELGFPLEVAAVGVGGGGAFEVGACVADAVVAGAVGVATFGVAPGVESPVTEADAVGVVGAEMAVVCGTVEAVVLGVEVATDRTVGSSLDSDPPPHAATSKAPRVIAEMTVRFIGSPWLGW